MKLQLTLRNILLNIDINNLDIDINNLNIDINNLNIDINYLHIDINYLDLIKIAKNQQSIFHHFFNIAGLNLTATIYNNNMI